MRALVFSILIIFAALLVILGLAPGYLSTPSGNAFLTRIINSQISGSISFEKGKFSWTGEQSIRNFVLKDHHDEVILTVEQAETETGILTLLWGGKFGESVVRRLNAHIVEQSDGTSNIFQALERDTPPPIPEGLKPIVIDLENVNGMISMGTPSIPKKIHFVGTTKQGDSKGSFNIEVDSHNDYKHMIIEAQVKKFPVAIFDQLIAYRYPDLDNLATSAIGKTFDLELTNTVRNGNSFFKLDIDSVGLQAELHGQLTKELLTVTTPSEVTLTLTPQLFSIFTETPPFSEPSKGVFILDQLKIPRTSKLTDLMIKFHLDADKSDKSIVKYLDSTEIVLDTKSDALPHLTLSSDNVHVDLLINASEKRINGPIQIGDHSQVHFVGQITDDQELKLEMKGNTLNIKAQFAESGTLNINGTFTDFPIASFCRFACYDDDVKKKVSALMGDQMSGNIDINLYRWSGKTKFDLRGVNAQVHLDGYLKQGVLKLNTPLEARMNLTNAVGEIVLQEIFPLFSGVVQGEAPVTLTIVPEDFALPLRPFDLSQINIAAAELDLNKVIFTKDSEIGDILSLLNPASSDRLLVWFTPLYFNVQNGMATLYRIDMLVMNEYPIAAWGKINLPADKVNMVIGLSARAIEQALKIKSLPANYMLQLSLKGTTDKASIDRRSAAVKISSLIAKTQGIEGNLIGTVIDVASGNITSKPAPQPTTQPLPWDKEGGGPKSAPKQKGKKKVSFILDQVSRGAKAILPLPK